MTRTAATTLTAGQRFYCDGQERTVTDTTPGSYPEDAGRVMVGYDGGVRIFEAGDTVLVLDGGERLAKAASVPATVIAHDGGEWGGLLDALNAHFATDGAGHIEPLDDDGSVAVSYTDEPGSSRWIEVDAGDTITLRDIFADLMIDAPPCQVCDGEGTLEYRTGECDSEDRPCHGCQPDVEEDDDPAAWAMYSAIYGSI